MTDQTEQYATEPVPEGAQEGWLRVGLISAAVAFSLPTFVVGLELANAVSPWNMVIATVFGFVIITVIGALLGAIGTRVHLSSYILVQIAFGVKGAVLVNIAFAISLLGWFGVNIDLFSGAIMRLAEDAFHYAGPVWPVEVIGGVLMTGTTVFGFQAIKTLSALLVPLLLAATLWMAYAITQDASVVQLMETTVRNETISLSSAISAVIGSVIIGAIIMPDTTRFIRHWSGAVKASLLSFLVVTVAVSLVSSLAGYAVGEIQILDTMLVLGFGAGAFVIVIAGSWILNSLNLYSCLLGFQATFPGMQGKWPVIVLGALGTVAASFDILDYFLNFLFYLSIAFVPVSGIIVVDYFVVRPDAYEWQNIKNPSSPISYPALGAWFAGFSISLATANDVFSLTTISACDAMIVSGLIYYAFSRVYQIRQRTET